MAKMWAGRTSGDTSRIADDFNSSIRFDERLYAQDIAGSMAHAAMLGRQGIITEAEAEALIAGLRDILRDLNTGALAVDPAAEDIHMFIEEVLTKRLGDIGKKLHTARSRNDQVALDLRLYLRDETDGILARLKGLTAVIADTAEQNKEAVMPGYTHLQHAQPILFAHHLLAYAQMFLRDIERLRDCRRRINISPIGACALAGTTYDTDRFFEAEQLGFDGVCLNSIDAVSDRDFCVELMSDLALIMMHLSRFSEELILWAGSEFGYVTFSDAYTTGSSIMPQKKNADMAELTRGKTGRVYGDLLALLTALKGLPLAYNKDMQEDKEAVFDAVDTVKMCLDVFTPMLQTMQVHADVMFASAQGGFMNATDLADYLAVRGLPFRDAYRISGQIVARCIAEGCLLETFPLEKYREYSDLIGDDVYASVDLRACVERRNSLGGTSPASVLMQLETVRKQLNEL